MDDFLKLDDDDLFTQSDFEEEKDEFCINLEENLIGKKINLTSKK